MLMGPKHRLMYSSSAREISLQAQRRKLIVSKLLETSATNRSGSVEKSAPMQVQNRSRPGRACMNLSIGVVELSRINSKATRYCSCSASLLNSLLNRLLVTLHTQLVVSNLLLLERGSNGPSAGADTKELSRPELLC